MNDWWNDPPEEPDLPECPECYDGYGEYIHDGHLTKTTTTQVFQCDVCGHQWAVPIPEDPGPEDF